MNTSKIDAFDEALRVIFLESAKEGDVENLNMQMAIMLPSTEIVMSDQKKDLLLQKLNAVITSLSFGQLLQQAMQTMGVSEALAAEKSSLPVNVIQDLKGDVIYTNNVPIKLLKNLLTVLNISFKSVEASIRKTFEMLQSQTFSKNDSFSGFSPAFRKGYFASRETFSNKTSKTDGKELYENKEALEKYLTRLNELMNS